MNVPITHLDKPNEIGGKEGFPNLLTLLPRSNPASRPGRRRTRRSSSSSIKLYLQLGIKLYLQLETRVFLIRNTLFELETRMFLKRVQTDVAKSKRRRASPT